MLQIFKYTFNGTPTIYFLMSSNNVFLKKSAITVILVLSSEGLPFNELVRRATSTSVTVSTRLKEFRSMGLIKLGLIDDKRVYKLTEKGRKTVPVLQKIKLLLARLDEIVSEN